MFLWELNKCPRKFGLVITYRNLIELNLLISLMKLIYKIVNTE